MKFLNMNLFIVTICTIEISAVNNNINKVPIVNTKLGKVKGYYKVSYKNQTYNAFTGIPYAKPPEKKLRFMPPKPMKPWKNIFDATKESKICLQYNPVKRDVEGTENCLYLNIFSPALGYDKKLPVIFFIHGGAFQYKSSKSNDPKYIMDKNVVFVSVNYRLSLFGFLSSGDKVVPGNMGLKDQSLALKWVVENIRNFGGNPKNITLMGCSAGGVSVHYHYLSPMSRGFFQKGISMSGTAMAPWAYVKNPLEHMKKLANLVDCPTNCAERIVRCLKHRKASQLVKALSLAQFSFLPVIEKQKCGYFINDTPENMIRAGRVYDVPWLVGVDSEEGVVFTLRYLINQTRLTYLEQNWRNVAPSMLFMEDEKSEEKRDMVMLAKDYYLGNKTLNVTDYDSLKGLIHMVGDSGIIYDAGKSASLQAIVNENPVYLYVYNFTSETTGPDFLSKDARFKLGVCHCDDENLILNDNPKAPPPRLPDDQSMQQIMLDMIYSFVSKGKPDVGVLWPYVGLFKDNITYMHIKGPQDLNVTVTENFGQKVLWDAINNF